MKKIIVNILILMSYTSIVQPKNVLETDYKIYSDIYKPINKPFQSNKQSKNKTIKTINFIPEEAFGGDQAQGTYNPKNQTAMIIDGQNKYNFIKIVQQRTNPSIPNKKNLDPNLRLIGSFSTKTNHAGMPVTIYVFGVQTKDKSLSNDTKAPSITFQPSDQFAGQGLIGNYFKETRTATISDPSGINTDSYSFANVFAPQSGSMFMSRYLVKIGSYDTTTLYGYQIPNQNHNESTMENNLHPIVGENAATWAPIQFQPAQQFSGDGLTGNYFVAKKFAMIRDASGVNQKVYSFENVQEGGIEKPDGSVLIGSYASQPHCIGNICSHAIMMVNLYGTLKPEEQESSDTPAE